MTDLYALCDNAVAMTATVRQLGTFDEVVGLYRARFCGLLARGPFRIPISFVLMAVPQRTRVGDRVPMRSLRVAAECQ